MQVSEMNASCKTQVFKDVVSDLMHSFRTSFKRLTESQIDMRLSRIRTLPIIADGYTMVEGRVKNLVGGRVTCALDRNLVEYLQQPVEGVFKETLDMDTIIEVFVDDLFDTFSSVSKNGMLQIGLNEVEMEYDWEKNTYYIQYDLKFKDKYGKTINSKAVFGIDEITSMYFRD
jgi:hypothetical protein